MASLLCVLGKCQILTLAEKSLEGGDTDRDFIKVDDFRLSEESEEKGQSTGLDLTVASAATGDGTWWKGTSAAQRTGSVHRKLHTRRWKNVKCP